MKKLKLFFLVFVFVFISVVSFRDQFTVDNVEVKVNYCTPYVNIILNDSFTYYLLLDSFQQVRELNHSFNFTSYYGELYFNFGNISKVYYSNQSVTNINLKVNPLQTITFNLEAIIDGAIKQAKLRVNEKEYTLPLKYDLQNKKTVVRFSNHFSFDFVNATFIYEDFCNTSYYRTIDVKYYSKDGSLSFTIDKEIYSTSDLIQLKLSSFYPAKLDILDENNNVLIGGLVLSTNSQNTIALSSISVVDYRLLKLKVYNEINTSFREILVYNPEKYICEIISDTFYRNEINIIKIRTNADSSKLYQLNTFLADCNNTVCVASLNQRDPLTLKCIYNIGNKKIEISTSKAISFAEKKYTVEFEVFDSLRKYPLNKYQISIRNKNSNNQIILRDKNVVDLLEGVYEISVSAGSNYITEIREVEINSNRKIQFYLNEVKEVMPQELLIYNINKYSDLVSITGSVKNAEVCEFYEGKNDVFIKLQNVTPDYFNLRFRGILGFDYFLICTNKMTQELFVIFENFDKHQVRIINQEDLLNKTKEEKNVPIFDLMLTVDYLKSQYISLFSFYQGLEPELVMLVEKVYYENFQEETKFLKSLNDKIVSYLKDISLEGITFNLSTSFVDLINLLSKIEILERNIKSLSKALSNETILNEFGREYFVIPERDKKRLETLDLRIPIKFHVSKFEYVQLNYEPIKDYVKYRCVVDRVTLTSFYRENSTLTYFYRISCPITPAIVVFESGYQILEDSTQKYFNKRPIYAFVPNDFTSFEKYFNNEVRKKQPLLGITGNFVKMISKNTTLSRGLILLFIVLSVLYVFTLKQGKKNAQKKIKEVKNENRVNKDENLSKLKDENVQRKEKKEEKVNNSLENMNNTLRENFEKENRKINENQKPSVTIEKIKEGKIIILAIDQLTKLIKQLEYMKSYEDKKRLYTSFLHITNKVDPMINDIEFYYLPQLSSELKEEFDKYIRKYKELRESLYRYFI